MSDVAKNKRVVRATEENMRVLYMVLSICFVVNTVCGALHMSLPGVVKAIPSTFEPSVVLPKPIALPKHRLW